MNILLLATTAQANCSLNGQPINCSDLIDRVRPYAGLGIALAMIVALVLIVGTIFWLLMLLHALNHNSPTRNDWIVVLAVSFVFGFGFIAALVYFFNEKKKAEAYPRSPSSTSSITGLESADQTPTEASQAKNE